MVENVFGSSRVFVVSMATVYVVFLWTAKNGPGDVFKKLRGWLLKLNLPFVSKHLLCPTCCALSIGALLWLLYEVAPALVVVFAVGGIVLVGHGLAGFWHGKDD